MALGDVLQSEAGTGNVDWSFTPTTDALILIFKGGRDGAGMGQAAPTGWTHLGSNGVVGLGTDSIDVYGKVSDGTESAAVGLGGASQHWWVATFEGLTLTGFLEGEGSGYGSAITTGSVTPTEGSQVTILGVSTFLTDNAGTFTPGDGWTEIFDDDWGGNHPWIGVVRKVESSASGSYNPAMTPIMADTGLPGVSNWWGITLALTAASPVPTPGIW